MNTRIKIIEEATELMLIKGYENVSLNEIAKKVGIAKPSIYYYFESKEKLFYEIIQEFFKEGSKWIESFTKENISFKEALFDFLKKMSETLAYFDQISINDKSKRLGYYYLLFDAFKNFKEINEQYELAYTNDFEIVKNAIEKAKKNKEIRPDLKWEDFALSVSALFEGTLFLYCVCPNLQFENIDKRLFDFIWNSIKY